jgi:hypothetical protein
VGPPPRDQLKGTVSRDFSPLFFCQTTSPGPNRHAGNYFEFFRTFAEILQCQQHQHRKGWYCNCNMSTDSLSFIDCSFKVNDKLTKALMVHHSCQRHRRFMHCHCHWHIGEACIKSINDTGEVGEHFWFITWRYQQHQSGMSSLVPTPAMHASPLSITLVKSCIAGVVDTVECMQTPCLSDTELMRYRTYQTELMRYRTEQIPNFSYTEHFRYRTCQIPNLSDSELLRFRTHQISNVSDTELIRYRTYQCWTYHIELIQYRTYQIPNLSDSEIIRYWN